jgi:hypothetical protein
MHEAHPGEDVSDGRPVRGVRNPSGIRMSDDARNRLKTEGVRRTEWC